MLGLRSTSVFPVCSRLFFVNDTVDRKKKVFRKMEGGNITTMFCKIGDPCPSNGVFRRGENEVGILAGIEAQSQPVTNFLWENGPGMSFIYRQIRIDRHFPILKALPGGFFNPF